MLKKVLKDAVIATGLIFAFKGMINFIFDPLSISKIFAKGFWIGIGAGLIACAILFVFTFLILLVVETLPKFKKTRTIKP